MSRTTITPISATYGAPMGRRGHTGGEPLAVYLCRIQIDSGGYDAGGVY
jgi:hypothetical protein